MSPPVIQPELLIVTEHFAPSTGATAQLITDLAQALAARGRALRVLTATSGDPIHGLAVKRFDARFALADPRALRGKALRGVVFLLQVLFWGLLHGRRGQRLLIVSNPPFAGLVGLPLRWLRGMQYVFVLQDLFPRSAVLAGVLPERSMITKSLRWLMHQVCSQSHATVVLSEAMAECWRRETQATLPLHVIPNWALEKATPIAKVHNPLALKWGLADHFTLQYSGNFGRLHDISTLLEAARLLATEPVHLLFIGGGAQRPLVEACVNDPAFPNLRLEHYQPRERLALSLGVCDLAAIALIPGAEETMAPCKFYGILASGRGVVLVARSGCDLARLILAEDCGIVVEPGDAWGLAHQLSQLSQDPNRVTAMGDRARALYERRFGFERSLAAYEALLYNPNRP